ncbi:LacI family DNA-binding transcriptional regulator [Pseudoponticoccus marisrubri]|uniref:LacI family transcriptional regulator n=1 Tax=Pseudoponticoccus marisrubri TaxID=1685382 RepID=A0A0W7WFC3_9RHOB|nr:LacI family DNA-binding transcriptional regulator [Pseudoponticoccus marisrubri]KUF09344.1 LacI family transcriptional regulator [Pseudoponticoccus marisrubri]
MVQKSVRIQDVARAAGVSTATVSRALSNPDLLAEATRTAVFDAIRETGYRVNQAARNLRKQRAGAILVLVPDLSNPFFSRILAGISQALEGSDYAVLITDTSVRDPAEGSLADFILDARVDGIISLDGGLPASELAQFTARNLSDRIVFACEWVHGAPFPSIRSDNEGGARLAIGHLAELGHQRIAHVTGPKGNVLTRMRREGMQEERARLGLPARDEWIIRGDFSMRSGQEAAQRILAMEDRPSAVFCASDMVAFGLISTLVAAGLSVPGDMSVIGFDDIEMSHYYIPALTTIRQDRHKLGTRAASMLLARLEQPLAVPDEPVETIGVELILRASTGPLPG